MKPSLQKLQKFFKLEVDRGYDNRAVVGGLDRMLAPWEAEARSEGVPDDLISAVVSRLRDYPHLSPTSRAETLEGLWRRIQREAEGSLPPLASPRSEKTETAAARGPIPQKPGRGAKSYPNKRVEGDEEAAPEGKKISEKADESKPEIQAADQEEMQETHVKTRPTPVGPPAALNAPVTVLSGVGPRHAQTLSRLGLHTLKDMFYFYPRRYDDYTQLKPINRLSYGEEVTIIGTVEKTISRLVQRGGESEAETEDKNTLRPVRGGRMQIVEAVISDGSGALRATWFNQPWIEKRLRQGMPVVLSGKIDQYLGRLVMNNPEWEPMEQQNLHTNRIVPVYPLTANITQRSLRTLMHQVVTFWAPRVQDHLPETVRRPAGMMDLATALLEVHFPSSHKSLQTARQRLAFDEIFLMQIGVLRQKQSWQSRTARIFDAPEEWLDALVEKLPFPLTGAQKHALDDVRSDLASGHPMNRLLQGDVGSGKTVIAALGIAMIARHGAQSAIMAPTSILAEQHYKSLQRILSQSDEDALPAVHPDQIRLMIGATPETEKRAIREGLASGEIKLVVGTHALIEHPVIFDNLQLVVVDEQHRFGVEQRALLRSKGDNPHLLVMTATPIPRSLALTVYGDLDLSVMDEMPPGRQAVETFVLYPLERERAYTLIKSQLEQEKQAFIIYPLVEEGENEDPLAAVSEYERLQKEIFPHFKVGLLHGRMKADEKEAIMTAFRDREAQVLVSTSVIEVGVDIPNATVMLIEGANRFGLAQLHQFRGRVGRGQDKAYCLLIPETADAVENERLQAMVETNDGFVLAERDLEQRGPGEFLGNRQSGFGLRGELRMANLTDVRLIEKARRFAQEIFEKDPDLESPENHLLASTLQRFWGNSAETVKGDIS